MILSDGGRDGAGQTLPLCFQDGLEILGWMRILLLRVGRDGLAIFQKILSGWDFYRRGCLVSMEVDCVCRYSDLVRSPSSEDE